MEVVFLKVKELIMVKFLNLTEHTDRLFNSAEILGISIPYSKNEINQAKDGFN